jgi:hypothetical protein
VVILQLIAYSEIILATVNAVASPMAAKANAIIADCRQSSPGHAAAQYQT